MEKYRRYRARKQRTMEGNAGPHVAVYETFNRGSPPAFQHQFLPGKGCEGIYGAKHGSLSGMWNLNFDSSCPSNNEQILNDGSGSSAVLNSTGWEGFSFMPRPNAENGCNAAERTKDRGSGSVTNIKPSDLRLGAQHDWSIGSPDSHPLADFVRTEQKRKQSLFSNDDSPAREHVSVTEEDGANEDAARLSLKLCSGSYSFLEDNEDSVQIHKRHRSSSPGSQSSSCQVDDCHADLKHAKDYHRRHKVCEVHSKAAESRVHGLMQRFCQQCSRFHPLPEFDEGKRSCRRRLAGHNRRRRKPHPGSNDAVKGSELLSVFAILSQLQLVKAREKLDVPCREQESTLLGNKESSLLLPIVAALIRDAATGASALNSTCPPLSQIFPGVQCSGQEGLFNALASLPPDQLSLVLHLLARGSPTLGKLQQVEVSRQLPSSNQSICPPSFPGLGSSEKLPSTSGGNMDSNLTCSPSPFYTEKSVRLKAGFNPSERPSQPTVTRQYLGAASPCRVERSSGSIPVRSASGSPAEKNLFPTHSGSGFGNGITSTMDMVNFNADVNKKHVSENYPDIWTATPRTHGNLVSDIPSQQRSDASESGSDQSPSSSSPDLQELSGRIIFKLFDKRDLGDFPQDLCGQIQRWLTHIPSSMEAYMRPGCILLTVFLAMTGYHWKELLSNFRGSLERLLSCAQCDLWRKGRIVVQVELQRALIVDGKIRRIKWLRSANVPILKSVRPLAVVAGEEATLDVRGHNLTPHTRILCVYHGKYVLHEVPLVGMRVLNIETDARVLKGETVQHVQRMHFPGGPANVLGRCFIEVENNLLGNILPVIVADKPICMELRSLERELDSASPTDGRCLDECLTEEFHVDKELDAISFLHELGWLFQRSSWSIAPEPCLEMAPLFVFKLSRFKALLQYAVLHDWCALVKKLLDLLFSIAKENHGSYHEAQHILSEVKLVHQAVKRKCRGMVEVLLQYVPSGEESRCDRVFTPVMEGPAGLTPLHIAASISNARDIIDALTNDPFEVGLNAWNCLHDLSGHTPQWHAVNSGNSTYVQLIDEKLRKRQSPCVRIKISQEATIEGVNALAARKGDAVDNRLAELGSISKKPTILHICRECKGASRLQHHSGAFGMHGRMYRPLMMMIVAVATLCAAVSLLFKGPPHLDSIGYSLKWEQITYGSF